MHISSLIYSRINKLLLNELSQLWLHSNLVVYEQCADVELNNNNNSSSPHIQDNHLRRHTAKSSMCLRFAWHKLNCIISTLRICAKSSLGADLHNSH